MSNSDQNVKKKKKHKCPKGIAENGCHKRYIKSTYT